MAIASVVFDPGDGSIAESKADQALLEASTADSKAVVADGVADQALLEASTADSKAVVADGVADGASTAVESAVGSEPTVGEFKVTDIERDTNGHFVFHYDDSAIT